MDQEQAFVPGGMPASYAWCLTGSPGVGTVRVLGDLDLSTGPHLATTVHQTTGILSVLIVDLRALDFIDSAGVRAVVAATEQAAHAGGRLIVVRGSERVAEVFGMMGLDWCLETVALDPGQPALRALALADAACADEDRRV